jgi:Ca2+-binding RTX toxin-like protein
MIEVKGTKTQTQETDPAQRYVLKDAEKKSKTPYAVGLFLTGMALYLKSIFPSLGEPEGGKPAAQDEPKGTAEPRMAQAEALDAALDPQPVGTVPEGEGPMGSGGNIIQPLPPMAFMMIDSPKIEFAEPEVDVFWNDFKSPSFRDGAANDNSGGGGRVPVPSGGNPPRVDGPDDGNTDPGDTDPTGPGGTTDPDVTDPGDTDPGGTDPGDEEPPVSCDCSCPEDDEPCGEDEDPHTNRAPRVAGPVYLRDVAGCAILAIGLSDLLRHATDPDGDMLAVSNLTVSSGTLTRSGDVWMYEGEPQLLGPVTITYQISDGEFSVGQSAHFSVVRSVIQGADADDMLLGTMCADDIDGGDGDDNIDGRAGSDVIAGGCGDDHIVAGTGDDIIIGGEGCDIIFGGTGNDRISGGGGDDRLFGEQGDDIVFGDAGDDYLSGGQGKDLLSGGQGDDLIEGDTGDDEIVGGSGNDELNGGEGDDVIDGGTGRDLIHGSGGNDTILDGAGEDSVRAGAGNDRVIAALDGDNDAYDGGLDCDTLDYSATSAGVTVKLASGSATGSETGSDIVTGFEAVVAGSGDDDLTGSDGAESLYGNQGDDLIAGGSGDDKLSGGSGDDLLADGDGEDAVYGGTGDDLIQASLDGDDDVFDGGEDCDTLDYSATNEGITVDLIIGTASGIEIGDDAISGFEKVIGGTGNDHFIAGSGPTVLTGGEGENTFEFPPYQSTDEVTSAMHEILDFKVGDRIQMSKYDLFEQICDEFQEHFEAIYGDDLQADDIPIRFSHDGANDMQQTLIEADFDDDDIYETTITLQGHHVLVIVEHA